MEMVVDQNLAEEQNQAVKHLTILKKEEEELSREQRRLARKQVRLRPGLMAGYARLGKVQCLQFIAVLQQKLPKELQQKVYSYLWSTSVIERIRKRMDGVGIGWKIPAHQSCGQRPCLCLAGIKLPHWTNAAYVGTTAAYDIVESLYRTHQWEFECTSFRHWVFEDVLHVGFRLSTSTAPLHAVIYWDTENEEPPPERYTDANGCEVSRLRAILQESESLLELDNKKRLTLTFALGMNEIRLNLLEIWLERIWPFAMELKRQGANVTILMEPSYIEWDSSSLAWDVLRHVRECCENGQPWKEALARKLDQAGSRVWDRQRTYRSEDLSIHYTVEQFVEAFFQAPGP